MEKIALQQIAAFFFEEGKLALTFDTFSDDFETEGLGHGDDRRQDHIVVLLTQPLNKAAIYLENIDRQMAQITERRIAGAKIVQRDTHPDAL